QPDKRLELHGCYPRLGISRCRPANDPARTFACTCQGNNPGVGTDGCGRPCRSKTVLRRSSHPNRLRAALKACPSHPLFLNSPLRVRGLTGPQAHPLRGRRVLRSAVLSCRLGNADVPPQCGPLTADANRTPCRIPMYRFVNYPNPRCPREQAETWVTQRGWAKRRRL